MTATLDVENLSVSYGGVKALTDVSLSVAPGELIGLIGPNGAGKTTFIDAVSGFAHASGSVRLDGVDLTALRASQRARAGLRRTWQTGDLYDDLTVRENLAVGAYRPNWRRTLRDVFFGRSDYDSEIAEMLGFTDLLDRPADELTAGQRKMVDIGRALAGHPEVLLLDEPAAGLNTDESDQLGQRLRRIADGGTGVLLVDHDMSLVLGVCTRLVVLDFGRLLATGAPAEIKRDERVIAAYLGAPTSDKGGAR